jgi:hypothetical protein
MEASKPISTTVYALYMYILGSIINGRSFFLTCSCTSMVHTGTSTSTLIAGNATHGPRSMEDGRRSSTANTGGTRSQEQIRNNPPFHSLI